MILNKVDIKSCIKIYLRRNQEIEETPSDV